MTPYKDLFISYGRRESLGFVARLHQKLKLAGYDVWFDKVNIPDGEEYAARINHGIESAHNFVYVMTPRALCSPYCLIEIEYARVLGKRIIPINQMVIFQVQGEDKPLSETEQAVLRHFYATHGLTDPNIKTRQQVLERSLKQVGRTDWLEGKEKLGDEDCDKLAAWAERYENHWHKHEDLAYLQTLELPVFGENIDTLASIINRIKTVLERHKDYVEQHTNVLTQALLWDKNQRATRYLPVGKERYAVQDWLLTEFQDDTQIPCEPSRLVCEFICEARKNGENLLTDAFICYDVADRRLRDAIVYLLSRHAVTTWQHDRDIQTGTTSEQAILDGIAGSTYFLYLISPRSVKSEYCQKELDYALSLNKRIIPILLEETPDIPFYIKPLQYIEYNYNAWENTLLRSLEFERSYYHQHKILLTRALKWHTEGQRSAFLLRGYNLENAKIWLRLNQKRSQHAPTSLHQDFIEHSEALKGQLSTDVFISYSRKDGDFARQLNIKLQEAGKTTWFDQENIASGVDFETELYKGIDNADNFVFIISPDSVGSEYCENEVNYAALHGKRIISLLHRSTNSQDLPDTLRVIHWIDCSQKSLDEQFGEIIQAIEIDREYVHQHTELQKRAIEWQEQGENPDFLLNQTACEKAKYWLIAAQNEDKTPKPTPQQKSFIEKSSEAILFKAKQSKSYFFLLAMNLLISLFFVSVWVSVDIYQARKNLIEELTSTAQLMGENGTASLAFFEKGMAAMTLSSLQYKTNIERAIFYDSQRLEFAVYHKDPNIRYPEPIKKVGVHMTWHDIHVFQEIRTGLDDTKIAGFIYIHSNLKSFYEKVQLSALLSLPYIFVVLLSFSFLMFPTIQRRILERI
jgi:hypothetical protein